MRQYSFFPSNIWVEENTDFLSIPTDKFIEDKGEFGRSYHSYHLIKEPDLFDFKNYVLEIANKFLDSQGFNMSLYDLVYQDLWVQQFSSAGGGYHSKHTHENSHVSGFYFLHCSENTSYPIFYDPRPAADMSRLELKKHPCDEIGDKNVHYLPNPGTMIFFNSYLPHEFIVDKGIDKFRFIHWNIQAIEKRFK